MSKYRDLTKEELEIINQTNYFSELIFQGLMKIFQPLGTLLIWIFILYILLLIVSFITGLSLNGLDPIITSYWAMLVTICLGGALFIMTLALVFFSDFFIKTLNNAMQKNEKYKYSIESIEEILENTYYIHSIIQILYYIRKIFTFFKEATVIWKMDNFLKVYVDNLYDFLFDLRSDLSIRISEHDSSLQSAKSEVEKNITGTTELNQVSELQRARLDRQIEQFEELQRVLVKI